MSISLFLRFFQSIALCSVLTACAGSLKGAPDRFLSTDAEEAQIKSVAGPQALAQYYASTSEADRRYYRSQIVLAKMYGIDILYLDYEAKLTRESQEEGFLSTITTIGLTSAATTVGSKELKTILAAAATGVAGANEAYNKDILVDRTVALLQEQMRAQRKTVKADILFRLNLPVADYPLELALSDVEAYYRAGTITGALIGVAEDSSLRLRAATAREDAAVATRFSPTVLGPSILAYTRSSAARLQAVRAWLNRNGISIPVAFFARSNTYAVEQQRLVTDLSIPVAASQPAAVAPPPVRLPPPPAVVSVTPPSATVISPPPPPPPGVGQEVTVPAGSHAAAIMRSIQHHKISMITVEGWLRKNNFVNLPSLLRSDHEADQVRMIQELHISE